MSNYTLQVLRYDADANSYESAVNILDTFTKHAYGQPICVPYLDNGARKLVFAIGLKNADEEPDPKCGRDFYFIVNDSANVNLFWNEIQGQSVAPSGDLFVPVKTTKAVFEQFLNPLDTNVFFVQTERGGKIYLGNSLYATTSLNDLYTEQDIIVGDNIYKGSLKQILTTIQDYVNKLVLEKQGIKPVNDPTEGDVIQYLDSQVVWAQLKTVIERTFVTNMEVGGIAAGTTIEKDTPLVDVVMNMLLKKKFATIDSYPAVKLGMSISANQEVGTTINQALSGTYTDGYFNSYVSGTTTQKLAAGCVRTSTKFYRGSAEISSPDSYKLPLGTTTYKVVCEYDASTTIAKDSDLTDSSISIPAGSCNATGSIKAYLRYFTQSFAELPEDFTREDFVSGPLITGSSISISTKFPKKYFAIAVPNSFTIKTAVDQNTHASLISSLKQYGSTNYKSSQIADASGDMQTYKVYVFEFDSSTGLGENNIQITF